MPRSLRARLFLTLWPLFVVAMLGVGALSSRSARAELAQFESRRLSLGAVEATLGITDSVAALWPTLRAPGGTRTLERFARALGDSLHLVVLDAAGQLVASSDPSLTRGEVTMHPNGDIEVTRTLAGGQSRGVQRLFMSGATISSAAHDTLGYLYRLPTDGPRFSGAQRMVAGIQRSLWQAVLLACLLAAAGTWLLAYPVVAQVQRLTAAAKRVQAKSLSTRVLVSSRDELGELEESFNRMAESLERNETAKRQLISDLAHELRTPLTNVIGLLEAMRDGLRAPEANTLRSTHEEALLLKQLIDELQELALADADRLVLDIRLLDARVEVQRAVDAFQAARPAIQLALPGEPTAVRGDPQRIAQVLRNVLQNAITHTPADGRITVSLHAEDSGIVIEVADTGSGIPAEHLPFIWDRFYRVDASRDRSTGGMGLGLALSRRLVEGMGGAIHAVSEPGIGTTITVRLPGAARAA